jgi:hypothetical protein
MKKLLSIVLAFLCFFTMDAQKVVPISPKLIKIMKAPHGGTLSVASLDCNMNYGTPSNCGNLMRNINFFPIIPFNISTPFNDSRVPEWDASSGSPNLGVCRMG